MHRRTEVVRRGEGGEPLKMVGTFQDVTERKRAENRLETQYAVARVLEASATSKRPPRGSCRPSASLWNGT